MSSKIAATKTRLLSSLTFKIFAVCFASTHIPLIALVLFLLLGFDSDPAPVLGIILAATLIGTIFCLVTLWLMLRPLHDVSEAVQKYRAVGAIPQLSSRRKDEVGVVANGVTKLIADLDGTLAQLRVQASTDTLTGLGNRRWLKEIGTLEVVRAARENQVVSLIVFDLDHFKSINDEFGHEVGDRVLIAAGAVIEQNLRPYDAAARIGGEEFCVLLPRTPARDAVAIADRLRLSLAIQTVPPLAAGRVTASFGVYCGDARNETLEDMMAAADKQLYAAKKAGRNTVFWGTANPKDGSLRNQR